MKHILLKKLFVKEEELNKQLLADTLQPLLQIEEKSGRIKWTETGNSLETEKKIIATLLARKAAQVEGVAEKEYIDYKELAKITLSKPITVASRLTSLVKKDIVSKNNGEYFITLEAVTKAIQLLKN